MSHALVRVRLLPTMLTVASMVVFLIIAASPPAMALPFGTTPRPNGESQFGSAGTLNSAVVGKASGDWTITVGGWKRKFARGGKRSIDQCKATLYWGSFPEQGPWPTWLAGHRSCGFGRWDTGLPMGARFKIASPSGEKFVYQVYGRQQISRRTGRSDGLIKGDITLQTCRPKGTLFVYAELVRAELIRREP